MSRENDKIYIWIVSPVKSDDGEIRIDGYTRLRKIKIACSPANGYIDNMTYGVKVSRIYKFNSNEKIDISFNGGDGIYFEEPEISSNGLYQKPTLISNPLTHFGKQWSFSAEMQIY